MRCYTTSNPSPIKPLVCPVTQSLSCYTMSLLLRNVSPVCCYTVLLHTLSLVIAIQPLLLHNSDHVA